MELQDLSLSCWKETGIFGDKSCPELAALAHCRNCQVYSTAGRRLLDREIPDGYREEWTERLAAPKETKSTEAISAIVFRLGEELLALKTIFFQEAAEKVSPHSIPLRTGEVFKGIVNINGELILCVSAAALLGISGEGGGGLPDRRVYPRIVVVIRDGQRYAFPVDEIMGVHRFPSATLQDPPATVSKSIRTMTTGILPWGEKKLGLLEEGRFFAALARSLTP